MDSDGDPALHNMDDALIKAGFERDLTRSDKFIYTGFLNCDGQKAPVSIEIPDLDFVHFPVIRFIDVEGIRKNKVLAHIVGPTGEMCYLDKNFALLDLYKRGPYIKGCLNQAAKVLADALGGRLEQEVRAEFFAYWGIDLPVVYKDLSPEFEGMAGVHLVRPLSDTEFIVKIVAPKGQPPNRLLSLNTAGSLSGEQGSPCMVVKVPNELSVDNGREWPPQTFQRLVGWLKHVHPDAIHKLRQVSEAGEGQDFWLMLQAPNCCALVWITIPPHLRKQEFLKTRRHKLFNILHDQNIRTISRTIGMPINESYIFTRNLKRQDKPTKNLAGKKILLIGCGTIGGFAAQQLVQCGAGTEGGQLMLADNENLVPANLGRHLLGVSYLGQNKAKACKHFLDHQLPYGNLSAYPFDISKNKEILLRYDLVIDATGEEVLSISINHYLVYHRPDAPPCLFARLLGNGAVAETIYVHEPEFACFKCEKPDLAGEKRHRVLINENVTSTEQNRACSDATYIPFPVTRSVIAASLAVEVVLDWSNGKPQPRYRSRVLDDKQGIDAKDGNPLPLAACPACHTRKEAKS